MIRMMVSMTQFLSLNAAKAHSNPQMKRQKDSCQSQMSSMQNLSLYPKIGFQSLHHMMTPMETLMTRRDL